MTLYILLLLSLWWRGETPSDTAECVWQDVTTVQLVPVIAEQPSQAQKKRIFYSTNLTVTYQPGQQVLLLPLLPEDGLFVDDFLQISDLTSGKVYRHDFRSADRMRVVSVTSAIDISDLFVPGDNDLEVFTQDLTPPWYSTKGMALAVVGACATPVPTPSPTSPPPPTATQVAIPTETPWPTPTATNTPTSLPPATASDTPSATSLPPATLTYTPLPQSRLAFTPPATLPSAETQSVIPHGGLPARIWVMIGSVVLSGVVLSWLQARLHNWVEGIIRIYETGKHVGTVNLALFHKQVLSIGRTGNIQLAHDPNSSGVSARLRKQRGAGGHPEVVLEYLAEPELTGQKTSAHRKPNVVQTQKLQHGDAFTIGPYRLIYQHYTVVPQKT